VLAGLVPQVKPVAALAEQRGYVSYDRLFVRPGFAVVPDPVPEDLHVVDVELLGQRLGAGQVAGHRRGMHHPT